MTLPGYSSRNALAALSTSGLVYPRHGLVESIGDDAEIGADLGVVEPDKNISGTNQVAVGDLDLADDTTLRMLDVLDIGFDDQNAGRDNRSGKLDGRRPSAEPANQNGADRHAGENVTANRTFGRQVLLLHEDAAFAGCAIGLRTLRSTSSFGPNAFWRPSANARILSTAVMTLGR